MSVRNALPWPLRWVAGAVMLGFSAAIALWAFEIGKGLAGLDRKAKEELAQLRDEVASLRAEREAAVSGANTSGSELIAEKAVREKMVGQLRQLEAENRALRDDLGFFERLLPAGVGDVVSIRSLHAETLSATQIRWQVLVIQSAKNAAEFKGRLELTVSGTLGDKPWTASSPAGAHALQFQQYRRVEGVLEVPSLAQVKTVTAKVMEGQAVRSVQTFKL